MFCKKRGIDYYFNSTGNTIEIVVIEFPPTFVTRLTSFVSLPYSVVVSLAVGWPTSN